MTEPSTSFPFSLAPVLGYSTEPNEVDRSSRTSFLKILVEFILLFTFRCLVPCRNFRIIFSSYSLIIIIIIIIIIIGIQPLGRSGQRPELSQATGMALVRCILGKFLGIVVLPYNLKIK